MSKRAVKHLVEGQHTSNRSMNSLIAALSPVRYFGLDMILTGQGSCYKATPTAGKTGLSAFGCTCTGNGVRQVIFTSFFLLKWLMTLKQKCRPEVSGLPWSSRAIFGLDQGCRRSGAAEPSWPKQQAPGRNARNDWSALLQDTIFLSGISVTDKERSCRANFH